MTDRGLVTELATVRETLEACLGDDFRLNGCECKPTMTCYLHAVLVPEALKALDKIEARGA